MADWKSKSTLVSDAQATPAKSWKDSSTVVDNMGSSFDPNDTPERYQNRLKEGLTPNADFATRISELPRRIYNSAREVPAVELKAIQKILSAANYPAGLIRTGIAGALGQAGVNDVVRAVGNDAPMTDEYIKRKGFGPGPNMPYDFGRIDDRVPLIGGMQGPKGNISVRDVVGFAGDVLTDPLTYVGAQGRMGEGIEAAGKMAYRSGVKNLDKEVAKYGKEAVSDILMKERIAGSAETIKNKMTELADRRLAERDGILAQASAAGAETDVNKSLKGAEQYLAFLKSEPDRRLDPLIHRMEGEVETLRRSAGQAASPAVYDMSPTLKELPVSQTQSPLDPSRMAQKFEQRPIVEAYDASTMGDVTKNNITRNGPVVNNPVDEIQKLYQGGKYEMVRPAPYEVGIDTPRQMVNGFDVGPKVLEEARPYVKAPTPEQMSRMKTNSYSTIGDAGYLDGKSTPLWQRLEKSIAGGQRAEVEDSVGRTLGADARQQVIEKNDELGRLLTSQDRAEKDALIASRKNYVSQIDGGMLAAGVEAPSIWAMYGGKQIARALQATGPRTYGGLALQDLGKNFGQMALPQGVGIRSAEDLLEPDSAWERLRRNQK